MKYDLADCFFTGRLDGNFCSRFKEIQFILSFSVCHMKNGVPMGFCQEPRGVKRFFKLPKALYKVL